MDVRYPKRAGIFPWRCNLAIPSQPEAFHTMASVVAHSAAFEEQLRLDAYRPSLGPRIGINAAQLSCHNVRNIARVLRMILETDTKHHSWGSELQSRADQQREIKGEVPK
jgi:hypothetical protein